jgi:hypothetical protein
VRGAGREGLRAGKHAVGVTPPLFTSQGRLKKLVVLVVASGSPAQPLWGQVGELT